MAYKHQAFVVVFLLAGSLVPSDYCILSHLPGYESMKVVAYHTKKPTKLRTLLQ